MFQDRYYLRHDGKRWIYSERTQQNQGYCWMSVRGRGRAKDRASDYCRAPHGSGRLWGHRL